jgi:hypothetical protein
MMASATHCPPNLQLRRGDDELGQYRSTVCAGTTRTGVCQPTHPILFAAVPLPRTPHQTSEQFICFLFIQAHFGRRGALTIHDRSQMEPRHLADHTDRHFHHLQVRCGPLLRLRVVRLRSISDILHEKGSRKWTEGGRVEQRTVHGE